MSIKYINYLAACLFASQSEAPFQNPNCFCCDERVDKEWPIPASLCDQRNAFFILPFVIAGEQPDKYIRINADQSYSRIVRLSPLQ